MSTHQEAAIAMASMNGQYIELVVSSLAKRTLTSRGYKIDISWALVQRETRHFKGSSNVVIDLKKGYGAYPNRVIHPPAIPSRRDPAPDCSVFVENLVGRT